MGVERTKPSTTAVIVVDVQDKLARAIPPLDLAQLERAARILLGVAGELGAPVIVTEQYPEGLGATVPSIRAQLEGTEAEVIAKVTFSACNEPAFVSALTDTSADAAIVFGMEAHICVFQTVRDLVSRGIDVTVPFDGVASRDAEHRRVGLALCEKAGATISSAETILFDWLVQSGTTSFRKLSKLLR